MASELHWFPFYGEDWLGSTAISMMLPEQEGAYLRLLTHAWGDGSAEPSLPANARILAQMSRLGARWKKLGPLIVEQFEEINGRLYNAKLTSVWQEQQLKYSQIVAKASAGGKAKAAKAREKRETLRASGTAPSTASGTAPSTAQARNNDPKIVLEQCQENLPTQNLEEAVEQSPTGFVLPASAPGGALALEGARAPGAVDRTPATRNGRSNGTPSSSAILAKRHADDADLRARAGVVQHWCNEHPDEALKLRTDLEKEFRGDDPIIARARQDAFSAQVLRRLEVTHV